MRSVDCINVNILAVMLPYSFARHFHGEKLGKGYIEISLHVNLRLCI